MVIEFRVFSSSTLISRTNVFHIRFINGKTKINIFSGKCIFVHSYGNSFLLQ